MAGSIASVSLPSGMEGMNNWIRLAFCLLMSLSAPVVHAEAFGDEPVAESVAADAARAPSEQIVAVPMLERPVTDLTATLGAAWVAGMEQRLLALQQRKGSQIAILMLPSTGEESIEQYATRVFEQWRLGRADVDDGVLVLVAKDDRAMRIEVGYGLEGAIPDVTAGRIIRDEMVPAFRQGDFAGGIENAVNVLERLIDGEALPEQAQGGGLTREGWLLLIAMLCGAVAGVALRRNLFATRRVVGVSVGLMVLLSFGAGFKTAPLFFMAVSFSMVLGGALGALAAGSRKSACIVGTVVGYIVALSVAASQYGAEVLLYGLGGPIALGLGLALLCLPFILARAAWRRSRLEFFVRLVLASGICVFLMTVTCIVERLGEFPDSLALLPMIYFPLLLAFTRGWAANSGSGSSGGGSSSSGGGGSYSGGGGSSGGGGASGSW